MPTFSYSASGSLAVSGSSTSNFKVKYSSSGILTLGGSFRYVVSKYNYLSSGILTLGGTPLLKRRFNTSFTGGLTLGSEAGIRIRYNLEASGGLEIGSSIFNPTKYNYSYFVNLESTWKINAEINKDFEFRWDIGDQPLRYYQVEGECQYPPTCDITGYEIQDPVCGSGMKYIQVIAARDLSDLCNKIAEQSLNYALKWPIVRIKRFSRPVFLDDVQAEEDLGVDHSCNISEYVEFCHIPECLNYCIDQNEIVSSGVSVFIQDTFFQYQGSGVLLLEGYSQPDTNRKVVGSGEIVLGGESTVLSSHYNYQSSGEMILSGDNYLISNRWSSLASGSLELEGNSYVVSSSWNYTPVGSLYLDGSVALRNRHSYFPSYGLFTLGGTSGLSNSYKYYPDSGFIFYGVANIASSSHHYESSGQLTLSGNYGLILSHWNATFDGGLVLSGTYVPRMKYSASGGLELSGGDNSALQNMYYYPSSGLLLSGEILVGHSPSWSYFPNSGLEVSGSFSTTYINITEVLYAEFDIFTELLLLEPADSSGSGNAAELEADTGLVEAGCSCDPIPLRISMSHNLSIQNELGDFLSRNKFTLPSELTMTYQGYDNTWRRNYHFRGTGSTSGEYEKWNILFEWGCADTVGGDELSAVVWKFSTLVSRHKLTSGERTESRILYTFPVIYICNANQVNFSFKVNTFTNDVVFPPEAIAQDSLISDEIGLFSGKEWVKKPELKIVISEVGLPSVDPVVDIKPIFPEPILI